MKTDRTSGYLGKTNPLRNYAVDDCTGGWRCWVRPGTGLDPMARVAGVSIDSRTVRAGELFVAIHGPRHDGHDYVAQCAGARSSRGGGGGAASLAAIPGWMSGPLHRRGRHVRGAQAALARAVREAWGGKIAGVTGSSGKTTTKEILAALLGAKLRVLKSEGNLNNEYGLPLTLFRLDETHQAAVLEMGMSHRGELAAAGGDCAAGRWRRDARGARASGIFFFGGRDCAGQARVD